MKLVVSSQKGANTGTDTGTEINADTNAGAKTDIGACSAAYVNVRPLHETLKITFIYAAIGCLWILLSDKAISMMTADSKTIILIGMIKGWIYVLSTSAVIGFLIMGSLKKIRAMGKKLSESNKVLEAALKELGKAHSEILASEEGLRSQVESRTNQLKSINNELEAFNYSVSHDLRAPLRGINGFCTMLGEEYYGQLDTQGKHYIDSILESTKRMSILIDELLNLSRLSRSEIKFENVNLSEIAESISKQLRESDSARDVTYVINPDIAAYCDKQLIYNVIENLLNNAYKFSCKHPKATIEFGMTKMYDRPVFYVKDDGAGFDMKYADKLFKPFQRLHSPGDFEGNGIGLASVRRIVNKHGGHIWAEGGVEKGAAFYFTLC